MWKLSEKFCGGTSPRVLRVLEDACGCSDRNESEVLSMTLGEIQLKYRGSGTTYTLMRIRDDSWAD